MRGFDKNILLVGTKDSSVLALDSETGNPFNTEAIHPKKPSKAIYMQVLGKSLHTWNNDQMSQYVDLSYQWSKIAVNDLIKKRE